MATTITLYHCVGARSFRPLWMLEELGLAYDLVMLPFPPRAHRKDYFEVNVLGTVPTLAVDGRTMTESAAICEYLAAISTGSDLHVDPADPIYPDYLNWLHFGEATLTFPQTLVLRYGRFEPPERRLPSVVEDYSRWFAARTRRLMPVVAAQEFLCGARFTAADVSVGYALLLAEQIGLFDQLDQTIRDYWQRLCRRDGYRRALAAEQREASRQGVDATPAPLAQP